MCLVLIAGSHLHGTFMHAKNLNVSLGPDSGMQRFVNLLGYRPSYDFRKTAYLVPHKSC